MHCRAPDAVIPLKLQNAIGSGIFGARKLIYPVRYRTKLTIRLALNGMLLSFKSPEVSLITALRTVILQKLNANAEIETETWETWAPTAWRRCRQGQHRSRSV